MASEPARALASAMSGTHFAQVTPISAATRLPPMMDQGWASGLEGTANSSTAEAPIGAMNHGFRPASMCWLNHAAQPRPSSAPRAPRAISRRETVTGAGTKAANHWATLRSPISGVPLVVALRRPGHLGQRAEAVAGKAQRRLEEAFGVQLLLADRERRLDQVAARDDA